MSSAGVKCVSRPHRLHPLYRKGWLSNHLARLADCNGPLFSQANTLPVLAPFLAGSAPPSGGSSHRSAMSPRSRQHRPRTAQSGSRSEADRYASGPVAPPTVTTSSMARLYVDPEGENSLIPIPRFLECPSSRAGPVREKTGTGQVL